MHFYSWKKGLKTGIYYLRSQAKTSAQKFSVDLENIKNKEAAGGGIIMKIDGNEKGTGTGSSNNATTKLNEEPPECLMCSS